MQINLSDVLAFDGMSKEYEVELSEKRFAFGGESFPVKAEPFIIQVHHDTNRQVLVTGQVDLSLRMSCSRCLKRLDVPITLSLSAKIDLDHTKPVDPVTEQEQYYVTDHFLDVDLFVFDELSLNVPLSVLCKEDCKGICPECGRDRNQNSCTCTKETLDPRMAKIAEIFKNAKEV